MTKPFEQTLAETISDLSKRGGRLEIECGPTWRTMTFKPGLSTDTIDRLIAGIIEGSK